MRRALVLALVALLAACEESYPPSEPIPQTALPNRPIADTTITGAFGLTAPTGRTLPITFDYVAPTYYAQVIQGLLAVNPDGSFHREMVIRRVTAGVAADSTARESGTWSRNAVGAITFSSEERGEYGVGFLNGTWTKNEGALTLQYRR